MIFKRIETIKMFHYKNEVEETKHFGYWWPDKGFASSFHFCLTLQYEMIYIYLVKDKLYCTLTGAVIKI